MNTTHPSLNPQGQANTHKANLELLLESIRAIGQEGLSFSDSDYDTARYEKLLELASKEYADITGIAQDKIRAELFEEHGSITPKVGVDIAVMNNEGGVLVLQRGDGSWCMPGGWMDVGESPFDTAKRETKEETGLTVAPLGYILITHKTPETHPGVASQVNICVGVEPVPTNSLVTISHEHQAYEWIHNVEEVDNWHTGQKRLFPRVFAAYKNQVFIPDVQ